MSVYIVSYVEVLYLTGGEDYISEEHIMVEFPAGKTRASFKVTINDDNILEGDEIFSVTIHELSVPYGITLGTLTNYTVTIRDNDSKHFVST